jgi:hypothetical protein
MKQSQDNDIGYTFYLRLFQNLVMYFWQSKLCSDRATFPPSGKFTDIPLESRGTIHMQWPKAQQTVPNSVSCMLYPHKECLAFSFSWKLCDWCSALSHSGGILSTNCFHITACNFTDRKFLHELTEEGCCFTQIPCFQLYNTFTSSSR